MWTYTCSVCGLKVSHVAQTEARARFTKHATEGHGAKTVVMTDVEE